MPKSHITGWTPDSPSPAQLAEFFRQCRGPNPRVTRRRLQLFLRSGTVFPNEELARKILGDDIIFPDEIAESRGLSYTAEQLQHFADTMPSEEALRWCKGLDYAIVAGPPNQMGLLEVQGLDSELFCLQIGGWYANQCFAKDDKAMPEWLAIRKEPAFDTMGKPWEEQLKLLPDHLRVPNVAEFAWFFTSYGEAKSVSLFRHFYWRISSVDSDGHHVIFGPSLGEGLRVYRWDEVQYVSVGLAVARKS